MKFLSRVVWSEGMHLAPHHFQSQSRYFEDTLWFLHSSIHVAPWGFLHLSLDPEAIRNGEAILTAASGVMPDGLIFDFPESDAAPQPLKVSESISPMENEVLLHLAVPSRQEQGALDGVGGSARPRYLPFERVVRDDTMSSDELAVVLGRKNLTVSSQAQSTEGLVSIPLARVVRDGAGGFAYDPTFIPPLLRIGASDALITLLQRLAESLNAKIDETRNMRLSSGRFELGTSALDVANYWFLHALCSAFPALANHLQNRRTHPEAVYRDLAQLAGALSTFSLESSLDDIPPYRHSDLSRTFRDLDAAIRRNLEVIAPSNSVTLQFRKTDPCFYAASVEDERCFRRARWIFGIRSAQPDSAVLRQTPRLVKICSTEGVAKLVQRALPGLELNHLSVPPSALHGQADMHYFSVSQHGPCWQHILQTRQVGVYIPDEIRDAVFEFTIILEAQA
jgi:type VI secretion system protein ImpJ